MKTQLINKYKDKSPEKTIDIIKNFFNNKGFILEEKFLQNPMPNAWWCRITLSFNGIEIQGANGKGTTKEFALASGYSELYERYCGLMNNVYAKKINQKKLRQICYAKNGYHLFPDEVFIPIEEILNNFPNLNNYCQAIDDNNNSFLKYYRNEWPNGVLSIPFKGFNTSDIINLPFDLLMEATGSSGNSAGNTIEEALTQGLSELCEHYVSELIFTETRPLPIVSLENINCSEYIKAFFKELEKNNYSYFIFDFSYLYEVPVIGLFIIDKTHHISFLNLGAFPVFDIALERCCTESYQGVQNILGDSIKKFMRPIRQIDPNQVLFRNKRCITLSDIYSDNLILNTYEVDNYNQNIFLNKGQYSNIEFNNYYKNIFNIKNWEVYYRDFSQDDNIKAIKAYVKNVEIKNNSDIHLMNLIPTLVKKRKWNIIFKWNQLINEYLNTKIINEELMHEVIELQKTDFNPEYNVIPSFCFTYDFFDIIGLNKIHEEMDFDKLFYSLINPNNYGQFMYNFPPMEYDLISHYSFLYLFAHANYSDNMIKKIAASYGIQYTEEDYENKYNILYYLNKMYFSPYYDYYNSKEYEDILTAFILDDNK